MHLGSDPEQRSPVDFGFDEAVWSPRSRRGDVDDAVVFPGRRGDLRSLRRQQADTDGAAAHLLEGEGPKAKVISTYDAKFRTDFDRKITESAMDFMSRSKQAGKPFYIYLPYTQPHIPPIPDPEFAGKTKRGNWADLLTQMDAFTGRILDKLDELGLTEDMIVVWTADNGSDSTYRTPATYSQPLVGSSRRA